MSPSHDTANATFCQRGLVKFYGLDESLRGMNALHHASLAERVKSFDFVDVVVARQDPCVFEEIVILPRTLIAEDLSGVFVKAGIALRFGRAECTDYEGAIVCTF